MDFLIAHSELLGILSSVVIIAGLPASIVFYVIDKRHAHQTNLDDVYVKLGDSYFEFIKVTLSLSELDIWEKHDNEGLDSRQLGQKWALFDFLIALFERAYILTFDKNNVSVTARRWRSWEMYMREWCERPDFREWLPELVEGEDDEFAAFMLDLLRTVPSRGVTGRRPNSP